MAAFNILLAIVVFTAVCNAQLADLLGDGSSDSSFIKPETEDVEGEICPDADVHEMLSRFASKLPPALRRLTVTKTLINELFGKFIDCETKPQKVQHTLEGYAENMKKALQASVNGGKKSMRQAEVGVFLNQVCAQYLRDEVNKCRQFQKLLCDTTSSRGRLSFEKLTEVVKLAGQTDDADGTCKAMQEMVVANPLGMNPIIKASAAEFFGRALDSDGGLFGDGAGDAIGSLIGLGQSQHASNAGFASLIPSGGGNNKNPLAGLTGRKRK